jgi:hypothetical protein
VQDLKLLSRVAVCLLSFFFGVVLCTSVFVR